MKNKIVSISLFIIGFLLFFGISCNAATLTVSSSKSTVEPGESFTVTVTLNNGAGNITTGVENGTGSKTEFLDSKGNSSYSVNVVAGSSGTVKISASGTAADYTTEEDESVNGSESVTIEVSEPESEPTQESQPEQTQEQEQPKSDETAQQEEEPDFTDVSKTVYSTTEVNLRSSWSTDSSATRIPKDTELLLTGTSTKNINGYVWYRVTYNGQLRYIASQYITETKPQNTVNLKTLEIEGVELKPAFNNDVTEYTGTIKNFTDKEIKVTATAEDSKTTVKVDGNKNIKFGENTITITVKAEDGTEKKFTIKLTNEQVEAFGLKTLKINDKVIKGFAVDKYEYSIDFLDLDKLDIKAEANEEGAKVEITGNEKLKEGKNVITIVVTSKDGKTKATYKITATKTISSQSSNEVDMKFIVISVIIIVATLLIIIILIVKYVKDKKDSDIDFGYKDNLEEENGYLVDKKNKYNYDDDDDNEEDDDRDDESDDEDDEENDDNDEESDNKEDDEDEFDDEEEDESDNEEDEEDDEKGSFFGRRKSKNKFSEYTVDDLYDEDYQVEELPKRKGKGKHSK